MNQHLILLDNMVRGGIKFLIYFQHSHLFLICIFVHFLSDIAETQTNLITLEGE